MLIFFDLEYLIRLEGLDLILEIRRLELAFEILICLIKFRWTIGDLDSNQGLEKKAQGRLGASNIISLQLLER